MTDIQSVNKTALQPENQTKKKQAFNFADKLANRLEESNVNSIQRLVEIFGAEVINRKVEEALRLYVDAEAIGSQAYKEPDTAVATGKSRPRTRGGVFFFLMREHCLNLGLNWGSLKISPAWYEHKGRKQSSQLNGTNSETPTNFFVKEEQSQATKVKQESKAIENSAKVIKEDSAQAIIQNGNDFSNKNSTIVQSVNEKQRNELLEGISPKPTRVKATVVGNLSGNPKLNPQGREGLLELPFIAEMGSSLPKGLPNLGSSKIVVWCTKKQFDKISQQVTITPQTRFLIEGEPVPAVGVDFSPFLRIICTRLTTVELEQRRKIEQ
jgi:PHAX RNA-binding domain